MEPNQLTILHDHYRDTCTVLKAYRTTRDWCFYLVILVIAVAWFDVVAPADFARVTAEAIKAKFQLTAAPNLTYLRGVLLFVLLGLTLRYCQAALSIERQYQYLHRVEGLLAEQVHPVFGRESAAYLSNYPPFLQWAHAIYVFVFPVLLVLIVICWTFAQTPTWRPWAWSGAVWFNALVSTAIVISVLLYLKSHRAVSKNESDS